MKRITFLLLIGISQFSLAQTRLANIQTTVGPEIRLDKRLLPRDLIGSDESGHYLIYRSGEGNGAVYLHKLSLDLALLATQKLPRGVDSFESPNTDSAPHTIDGWRKARYYTYMTDDRIFYLSFFRGWRGSGTFKMFEIDKNTLEIKAEKPIQMNTNGKQSTRFIQTRFSTSPNTEKVAMAGMFRKRFEEKQPYSVNVFDKAMNLEWQHIFEIDKKSGRHEMVNAVVDNSGTVHLLVKRYGGPTRLVLNGVINFEHLLFSFHKDGSFTTQKIDGVDKFILNLHLSIAANGDLVVLGNYGYTSPGSLRGIYFARFDATNGQLIKESFNALDNDFLAGMPNDTRFQKVAQAWQQGIDFELNSFDVVEYVYHPDGTYSIMGSIGLNYGEDIPNTEVMALDYNALGSSPLLVIKVNASGEVVDAHLNSLIRLGEEGYVNYARLIRSKEEIFLYIRLKKAVLGGMNFTGELDIFERGQSPHLYAYRSYASEEIISGENAKTQLRPPFSFRIDENQILILGYKGKTVRKQRFVKVNFLD